MPCTAALPPRPAPGPALPARLRALAGRYGAEHLGSDPLQFPRSYSKRDDREAAAFVASALAFGNAKAVCASVASALGDLGPSPSAALHDLARGGGPRPRGPLHRWVRREDLIRFLAALGRLRREAGSLEAAFVEGDPGGPDLRDALTAFVARVKEHVKGRIGPGLRYLLVSPAGGSACKRWNMLLRWLVRRDDGLDLGLWPRLDPSRLVVPLDTHVARISRYVGLTGRRTPDWRTAVEVTEGLRGVDPADPVRFDFAIARLGILDHCPTRRDPARCLACPLFEVCVL